MRKSICPVQLYHNPSNKFLYSVRMVTGWRRAFCTSIPKDREAKVLTQKQQQHCENHNATTNQSPKISSKLGFFSNPSTPRLESEPSSTPSLRCRTTCSVPNSPKLQCKTRRLFHNSNPSSPKSPSSFSLLKATLRLSKSRCGICMQSVRNGQGTAIFTAECSHTFHFPCIVKKHPIVTCPVCNTTWKELPFLSIHNEKSNNRAFKVYNDDEPLISPISLSRFNPIPESENEEEEEEDNINTDFQGFNVNPLSNLQPSPAIRRNLELSLLPEAAIVSANRNYETYVVVLKLKPPQESKPARRAPIDLVAVLDVGGTMSGHKLRLMKNSMRQVISSLRATDRLSIVAFSAGSKRLLSLRRMTGGGQRSAGRIVDALAAIDQSRDGTLVKNDAVKKAAKVLEDRREKNAVASIVVLSDINDSLAGNMLNHSLLSTTRLAHLEVPVHAVHLGDSPHALSYDALPKFVGGLLSVVAQDVRIQIEVVSRSQAVEIAGVYSLSGRPASLGPSSIRLGDLYAGEVRELLVELKVPATSAGSHHVMTVRSCYLDPFTRESLNPVEKAMLIPRPHTVRSSCTTKIERLRNLHVSARAVAESSRLAEINDLSGAHHLLSSARALLLQSSKPEGEFVRWLEAEQAELQQRRQRHSQRSNRVEEKVEPLTPTSAWRAAEKLAKVAITRKSMNRVSDLHGFENARF